MSGAGTGNQSGSVGPAGGEPLDQAAGIEGAEVGAAPDVNAPSLAEMEAIFAAMPNLARDIFIAWRFHKLSMEEMCRQTGLSRKQVRRQFAKAVEHLHHSHSGMEQWREHVAALPLADLETIRASLRMSVRPKSAYERVRASCVPPKRPAKGPPPDAATIARMNDALLRMSRLERDVFLSVRLDYLSYAEIGEKIGMSDEKVMKLVGRALYNLDRNLRDPHRHWWRRWLW
ncbi:sigma factor-like helix-turn-helix DNA-binding protein [Novosphingobium terrae]|uniref:sigma factor-like helix-turn-helix DNA-binding protein n=1 Tax=Novosphingobium terrae TaxID=2726189 RepID=UPI001F1371E1|nr:sigma factor-like helix-turn-helix DNA-binding protein [Novosphingobium terrae]